jgi:hypothetical protein
LKGSTRLEFHVSSRWHVPQTEHGKQSKQSKAKQSTFARAQANRMIPAKTGFTLT